MLDKKITKFSGGGIKNTTRPEFITLQDAFDEIESGVYQKQIEHLRSLDDEKEYKQSKTNLDYYVMSCTCTKRDSRFVQDVNGLICIDVDDLDSLERIEYLKDEFRNDKYIIGAFESPSGKGLKILGAYDQDKYSITDAFYSWESHFQDQYQVKIDKSCKDIARACFVSYDKEIYINENAVYLPVTKRKFDSPSSRPAKQKKPSEPRKKDFEMMEGCVKMIEKESILIAHEYDDWVSVGLCLAYHFGEAGRGFFHRISQVSKRYDGVECDEKYDHLIKSVKYNIPLSYIYHKSGFINYKGKKLKRIKAIEYLNDLGVKRNLVLRKIETKDGDVLDEYGMNTVYLDINLNVIEIAKNDFYDIVNSNYIPSYNPLKDYYNYALKQESGDEFKRLIDSLKYKGKKSYQTNLLMKWLLQIPAAIHGHVSELLLVLIGPQGNGKTEFFRRLFPKELQPYFTIDNLDRGKDSDLLMTEKLVILDDEFGGKSKKDASHLKSLLSKDKFSVRVPYGKGNEDIKRLCVMCGTCNTLDVIYDNTGNRRIIPIELLSRDFDLFDEIDKNRLWSAIFKIWENDKSSHKPTREELKFLNRISKGYQVTNKERELIEVYFDFTDGPGGLADHLSASEICVYIERKTGTRLSHIRVGQELSLMGINKTREKLDGYKNHRYGYWTIKKTVPEFAIADF